MHFQAGKARWQPLILLAAVVLGLGVSAVGAGADDAELVASVDGTRITRASFDEYKAVFTSPDGASTVSDEVVLLSLINQALVRREAERLGIVVTEAELDEAVEHWGTLDIAPEKLSASGGLQGLRERFKAFAELRLVRDQVLGEVAIPDAALRTAHAADFGLAALPFSEVADTLRQRLIAAEIDARWVQWLADQRRCAEIRVFDTSLGLWPSAPGDGCGL